MYSKSVQRLLGSGIDYRVRPTELPDSAAQKMENFAFDEQGSLRSRKGHELICNASGSVRQIIHGLGARWAATSAAVDKNCTALIAVPNASIVAFKDFIWAGRSLMRKSDGTNDWRWIPKAPTDAPTIQTMPDAVTLVDDFQTGWLGSDGEELEYNLHGVDGLFIQGDDATTISATKEVTLNLYDGQDKDDLFRIQVASKNWSKIAGVSFDVDVGDGSFTIDYYKTKMPLKEIIAARKETVTFYLRKRPLEVEDAAENKNQWGYFERIGQTTDKDWRSVVKLRVKVEFTEATRFWFIRWDMVGNEDNTLEGDDFGAYYTYTTAAGHESNPSPKSKLITVNHGSIRVTDLVPSTDPQVTAMNVYLTGGTLGAVYRVNIDPIPQAEEYVITQSANDLTDLNIPLEEDHDDPPAAEGIAGPYYGRILAWKGSRFYWSHQNKPFAFSNPDGPDGDWADLDESAGDIIAMSVRPDHVLIYCENDVFVLDGDPADLGGIVQTTGVKMGTPSRNGVAQAGPADVAYLGSGVYLVDASGTPRKLSAALEPIFQNRTVSLWDGTTVAPVSNPAGVCIGYEDGIVRFGHSDRTYVCSLSLSGPISDHRWVSDSRRFTCFASEGEAGVLAGQANGAVLRLEVGATDDGAAIPIDYLSKAYDCGIQDNEKRAEDVTTYFDAAGNVLTETVYYTEGLGISTTLTGFNRDRKVFQLNGANGIRARNFAVAITGNINADIFVDVLDLNYYPEAREALSYDTAVSDAGDHRVKRVRELQVDIENAAALTLTLETDVPFFALASRQVSAIGANLFRRTEPVVMTSEVFAHDLRVVLSGAGYFHCWGVRALVQAIGHYLHGQKGEYYLSDPVDWGTERVKLAREIEIVYRTVGSATVTLYSDLPTGVFPAADGSVASFNLTQQLGEYPAKLRLTGLIKGRLFQLRIDPTADFILEAVRMRIKMIGEPAATPWQWIDFPLAPTQDGIWVQLPEWPQDQVA